MFGKVIEMGRIFWNGLQVDGCWEGDIWMFLLLMAQWVVALAGETSVVIVDHLRMSSCLPVGFHRFSYPQI